MSRIRDQVIALSALTQSCLVTASAARSGSLNSAHLSVLIHSLFDLNPVNTLSVYGDVSALKPGLQAFANLCAGNSQPYGADLLKYEFALIHLEGKLRNDKAMMDKIGYGLDDIARDFPDTESRIGEACIRRISDLYQNTVSTMNKRIQVQGSYQHLQNKELTWSIRAALFAGLRATVLWQQLGGSRWHLMFRRKQFIAEAKNLLDKCR